MCNLKNVKNTHGGVLLLVKLQAFSLLKGNTRSNNKTLLKVTLLYGWFLRFLNRSTNTKSRNASQQLNCHVLTSIDECHEELIPYEAIEGKTVTKVENKQTWIKVNNKHFNLLQESFLKLCVIILSSIDYLCCYD